MASRLASAVGPRERAYTIRYDDGRLAVTAQAEQVQMTYTAANENGAYSGILSADGLRRARPDIALSVNGLLTILTNQTPTVLHREKVAPCVELCWTFITARFESADLFQAEFCKIKDAGAEALFIEEREVEVVSYTFQLSKAGEGPLSPATVAATDGMTHVERHPHRTC